MRPRRPWLRRTSALEDQPVSSRRRGKGSPHGKAIGPALQQMRGDELLRAHLRAGSAEVDLGFQIGARVRARESLFERNAILFVELVQRRIEALHATLAACH